MTASLSYSRSGTGPPLVLLHGLGASRRSWEPVIPALAARFDVIAVDLPGFGDSAELAARDEPAPQVLARAVAGLLDELGVTAPHLAGNSLGGWVALEFAAVRPAASLTLLSPAGLWRRTAPWYSRMSLQASRWLARYGARPINVLVRYRLGRTVLLGQTHGHPMRLTPGYARSVVHAIGTCPGFGATLKASAQRRYLATTPFGAPVNLAFGSRDLILLPWQSRHTDQLPARTLAVTLAGCGHVPMADDPDAVAGIILDQLARRDRGDGQTPTSSAVPSGRSVDESGNHEVP
jgi:pimeloyl-ACP methyl ester carboxylesterase